MTSSWFLRSLIARRHGALVLFIGSFMLVGFALRMSLLVRSAENVDWGPGLLAVFGAGILFDLGAGLLVAAPGLIVLTVLPSGFSRTKFGRIAAHIGILIGLYLCLFSAVAEWTFWEEFDVRFNFIAVDYLVYTTEVLGNIRESYPMPAILASIGLAAIVLHQLLVRSGWISGWLNAPHEGWRRRYVRAAGWLAAMVIAAVGLNQERLLSFGNNTHGELAKNGVWSLFAAFRNNELTYDQFYATVPDREAFRILEAELAADHGIPLTSDPMDTLRFIGRSGDEQRLNVIQITVESLSASFLGAYGSGKNLTPHLDALAEKSLLFTNLFATGTRTDRGMEALSLSLPPTPGRSLIKRPRNRDLFTLGSVFRSRGYDTAFIYGGYGYFDNMNAFFGGNGYRVVDRASVADEDITFANAWGACDEDLLRWTTREADAAYAREQPFHFFVMTTSNHRPFTYPEGRIDLPPKVSGRDGAVKYTDFAIGQFIREASSKPWFKRTLFVIVADHCASVAGRTELPVENYHIPLLVYAPGGQVAASEVSDLMSQVDYAPTLLGLLNWSYGSRFFGWDVLHAGGDRRALVGNYQKLGLYEPGVLGVLSPREGYRQYAYDAQHAQTSDGAHLPDERSETIAYYQTASYLYRTGGYGTLTPDEQKAAAVKARALASAP